MKVKCISSPNYLSLRIGDTYDVLVENEYTYELKNGLTYAYPKELFEVVTEVNLPPMSGAYKEAVEKMLDNFSGKSAKQITYKDFLASMPEESGAAVSMYQDGSIIADVYGFEFECKTEERAEEVYAALMVLFKEE